MLASVIVCTYRHDIHGNILDAVASLLNQTYPDIEIIIVVDGDKSLGDRIATIYDQQDNVHLIVTESGLGVSAARNFGIKKARGDIIAFLDDDAVADRRWIEEMTTTYDKNDAIAVGGAILPMWLAKKPDYMPEELYWLVGLTHDGFIKEGSKEVRNVFAPNMSFKREVFEKVGFLNEDFGFAKKGTSYIQGEEPEFALRMKSKLGKGVIYNPELIVYHKVPAGKTRLKTLLRRAFYQGYSKALLKRVSPSSKPLATEQSYLKDLLFKYIPRRVKMLFLRTGSVTRIKQLSMLFASILAVGLGFIYGYISPLPSKVAILPDRSLMT